MERRTTLKIGGATIMGGIIGANTTSGRTITESDKRNIRKNFPMVVLSEGLSRRVSIIENKTEAWLRTDKKADAIIRLRPIDGDLSELGIVPQFFYITKGSNIPSEIINKSNFTEREVRRLFSENNTSIRFDSHGTFNLNFESHDGRQVERTYIDLENKSIGRGRGVEFLLGIKLRETKPDELVSN